MIEKTIELPVTAAHMPFAAAARYLDLPAYGYEEKEYRFDGTANVYETVQDEKVKVKVKDVPYRNRMIIRRPADPSQASGHVVVEIINPTSGMEIDRMWILGYRKFMRDGDIYVGITSKPNTIRTMLAWDRERYSFMSWPNPTPEIPLGFDRNMLIDAGIIADYDQNYETGLFWDMLNDMAELLRSDNEMNPLRDDPVHTLVLTGWSQSACYLIRYLNSFPHHYDGYLTGGPVRHLIAPVNQYETMQVYPSFLSHVHACEKPLICVQTQSDNASFKAGLSRVDDSDDPSFRYRLYEIAGASHDTMATYPDYYRHDPKLEEIGCLPVYHGQHAEGNDYPSSYLFMAAFRNLFTWIDTGRAPGHEERMQVDEKGENVLDENGNGIGGLRTCLLNAPTCTYHIVSRIRKGQSPVSPKADTDPLFGYEEPFAAEKLVSMYGTLDHYRRLCIKDTEEQVKAGFLCKEDAEAIVDLAVSKAKKRGLV